MRFGFSPMRIIALTLFLGLQVACGKPGRGEHIVTWPVFVSSSSGPQVPSAVDESGIYAFLAGGKLARAPLDGGVPEVLADTGSFQVQGQIVLTADEVIWTDWGNGEGTGSIRAMAKGGAGTVRVIASSQGRPTSVARDAIALYWSTVEFPVPGTSFGAIRSVPIGGGSVSTVVSGTAVAFFNFVVGATQVYFGQESTAASFGGPPAPTYVGTVAKDGTGIARLADDFVSCCMLLRQNDLLWMSTGPPRVRRLDIPTGTSATVSSTDDGAIWMAADSQGVFISTGGCEPLPPDTPAGACWSWLRNLTTGEELAYANQPAQGIAIDSRYVYWMVGTQDLYRVRR